MASRGGGRSENQRDNMEFLGHQCTRLHQLASIVRGRKTCPDPKKRSMTISAPRHSLSWGGMGIFSVRGSPSTLKMKTHSSKCFPLCASKWLLNESNLIITFIINSVRIRWNSVTFVFDLRVCQVLMRVLGSVWWLFYPQPYVYMKPCQQTELRNLEEVFDFFFL